MRFDFDKEETSTLIKWLGYWFSAIKEHIDPGAPVTQDISFIEYGIEELKKRFPENLD